MKKIFIILILLCPLFLYAGKKRYVKIKKGETLWRISKRYNIPLARLKRINKIKNVSKINAGTKIYLSYKTKSKKSYTKKKYKKSKYTKKNKKLYIKLKKPVNGKILNNFNQGGNLIQCNGIEYITKPNARVNAALKGTVKFTGTLRGYGKVVVIQYSNNISTIYAYLKKISVKQGQKIDRYQTIGITGKNNFTKKYVLHFELLKNGKPINPKWYF